MNQFECMCGFKLKMYEGVRFAEFVRTHFESCEKVVGPIWRRMSDDITTTTTSNKAVVQNESSDRHWADTAQYMEAAADES